MAILRIKDENGNVIPVKAIKGEDGKSAFQHAQEGGFVGTEEEFNVKLASIVSDYNNILGGAS